MCLGFNLSHFEVGVGEDIEEVDVCSDGLFDLLFQAADGLFGRYDLKQVELLILHFVFEKYLIEALS